MLARVDVAAVADAVLPRVQAGQVGVALVTELEVGDSARSSPDDNATRQDLLDLLIPVTMPLRAEERARELQRDLVTRGQHRGVSVPDLVLAAVADIEELIIPHFDADVHLRRHRSANRIGRTTWQRRLTERPPHIGSDTERVAGSRPRAHLRPIARTPGPRRDRAIGRPGAGEGPRRTGDPPPQRFASQATPGQARSRP